MPRNQIHVDTRNHLVERVAASRYIRRSARLRSLLLYLCERVLEHGAQQIHEQEVGHAVFGRPMDYDTMSDNIVRVHASMLRKRLDQYFSSDGRDEPIVIELPKGNYAPIFVKRPAFEAVPALEPVIRAFPPAAPLVAVSHKWRNIWLITALAIAVASASVFLLLRRDVASERYGNPGKTVRHGLWSQIFASPAATDIVLDDEGVGLYQELTGTQVQLSDYFNRNYLRGLAGSTPKQGLDQAAAESIVLKRQSSYASAVLLWRVGTIASEANAVTSVHFARDYSFRELQSNNAILIGNEVSNPWIDAFRDHIGFRWEYDSSRGAYYPVDLWDPAGSSRDQLRASDEGYASVAVLPNLSGTGTVLILSSSGGSALSAASDFLADNDCVRRLTSLLPHDNSGAVPYYEALLRIKSRSRLTRDIAIVVCRKVRT